MLGFLQRKAPLEEIRIILSYTVRMDIESQLKCLQNRIPFAMGMPSFGEYSKNNEKSFKKCIELSIKNFNPKIDVVGIEISDVNATRGLKITCNLGIINFKF